MAVLVCAMLDCSDHLDGCALNTDSKAVQAQQHSHGQQLPRPRPERVQRALFIPEDLIMEALLTALVTSGIYFRGLLFLAFSSNTPKLSVPGFVLASQQEGSCHWQSFRTFICCSISLVHTALVLWLSTVQSIKCILLFAFGEKSPDSNPVKLSGSWQDVRDFVFVFFWFFFSLF